MGMGRMIGFLELGEYLWIIHVSSDLSNCPHLDDFNSSLSLCHSSATLLTRSVTSSMIVTMSAKAAPIAEPTPAPEVRSIPAPPLPPIELSHVGGVGLHVLPSPATMTRQPCAPAAAASAGLERSQARHDMARERARMPLKSRRRRTSAGAE